MCDCRRLRARMVVLSLYDILVFVIMVQHLFVLGDLDEQSIYGQRQKMISMVVYILHILSHIYYSHNSNVKCVGLTIKYIGFESIHYAINLDVVSSSMVFNNFDCMFLLMYRWFKSM